jgi:uncharacterized membrane protein
MNLNRMALSATTHCLTGCAIGEIAGLLLGSALGWSNGTTVALAFVLSFLSGYALSTRPLVRGGLGFVAALRLVLAADTLSILTMEVVDNVVMLVVPGAMTAGLADALYWGAMVLSLAAAFAAAFPVNRWLLARRLGHALTHAHHVA